MSTGTIMVALAVVLALIGFGWYRGQRNHVMKDELVICNFLILTLFDDEIRKKYQDEIWNFTAALPETNDGRLVAATCIHLIKAAKEKCDNSNSRRELLAFLIGINGALPR